MSRKTHFPKSPHPHKHWVKSHFAFKKWVNSRIPPSNRKIAFLEKQRLRHKICRARQRNDSAATCEQTSCLWTGALRATTKRGGLPSGFAAGMSRRRLDLKVDLQVIRLPSDLPVPSTFVKCRRAIPTFGSRQAPRHEPGFARHEYPRTKTAACKSKRGFEKVNVGLVS